LGTDLSKLPPTDAKVQCYFHCFCNEHVIYILLMTIHKQREKALRCKVCEEQGKRGFAKRIWGAVDACKPPVFWVPEARILRGRFAYVDAFLPDYKLAIQVDGPEQYGREVVSQSAAILEGKKRGEKPQALRDAEFNEACAEQGYHLLRIHEDDLANAEKFLSAALARCSVANGTIFRMFTRECVAARQSSKCEVVWPQPISVPPWVSRGATPP
jgi:hypothetical protein